MLLQTINVRVAKLEKNAYAPRATYFRWQCTNFVRFNQIYLR